MTRTSQLDAHYAVIQLDSVLRAVVDSFRLTCDLLVDEVRERAPNDTGRHRLRGLLTRYRAGVLELGDVLVALRAQCGTDADDLPGEDADVLAELARIRAAHGKAKQTAPVVPCSPALAAAADEALEALRERGAL